MGTWGTGISSNDTFSDVYDDFFKYYNEGDFPDEILKKLMIEYQEVLDNEDDFTNFWFAVAKAQWECKALEENIFNQIKWIVEEDIDINIWRNLDASEKDLKTRRNVLIKFLDSLKVEKAKPKARKAKKTNKNIFEKGDCLSLKLINGNYGGAIVLESFINEEISANLIAFTRINQKSKPTIEDVRNSELLIKNFGKWKNEYFVNWFFPIGFKKVKDLFEVIGKLKIQNDFNPQNNPQNFLYSSFNETIFQIIDAQIEKEKIDNVIINQRKLIDFVNIE